MSGDQSSGGAGGHAVAIAELRDFAEAAWGASGFPAGTARVLADVGLEADLRGHHDHGVGLILSFRADVRAGQINLAARPRIVREAGAAALVDGDGGFGAPAARLAMSWCVERARGTGVAVASVRSSSHTFYPGYYAALAADAGLVGFFTTTSRPAIAPPGGGRRIFGQNPIAYGIPAGTYPPILLDIGTAASAAKIRQAAAAGRPIPGDWAFGEDGRPTTDAAEAIRVMSLIPIGGHKGFGLSMVMDALAAGLGGAPSGRQAGFHGAVGHFMWALDPGVVDERAAFLARVDALIAQVKASASPGVEAFYPGERGARARERALARGALELPAHVAVALETIATELSIPPLVAG